MEEKPARLTGARFLIQAEEAEAMAKEAGVAAVTELLPLLVPAAQRLARPPISNYRVGAVGLGTSGRIFLGANLEFPGLPLNHSVHAEQFLVANAAAHGETGIRCFAVSTVPCGHCRQFLQEIRGSAEIQILVTSDEEPAFRPLASLLPLPFGPPDLLHKGVPLLLEPHDNALGATVVPGGGGGRGLFDAIGEGRMEQRLRAAAEAAARASHAPYSGCAAGFAVADVDERVYAGSYLESAAYNPSLGPMQAAMVAWVAAGGGGGGEDGGWGIVAATLVEEEAAVVSHVGTARIFLEAMAPGAHLEAYRLRSSKAD
ncbi:cytidine deaminase 1-like [Musa acuminata AAA Group]|uniref:cytidine deaminase 1-like n=1 Tax=Musa acuminata AAA Group TaxID=214697 RepID=UPI0031D5C833